MRRRMLGAVAGASLLGAVLAGCETVPPSGWAIELASTNASGADGANADSQITDISADGTQVLFRTYASNLGPTDTNGYADVYMRDLTDDTTTLITRNAAGTGASTGGEGVFSPDGTKLAFVYDWWEQIPPSGDHAMDIFVHDFVANTTTLATPHTGGTSCTAGVSSYSAAFGPDSSQLAFVSDANDLGPYDSGTPGDFSDAHDVYLRDLVDNTTSLISVNAAGTDAVNKGSGPPAFTPDGAKVMFTTKATGMGANDINDDDDVYLRDLVAGTTELVSIDTAGVAGSGARASISPDGTKIAFQSRGKHFGPVDNDPPHFYLDYDIYVRDLASGVTTLASPNAEGTDSANSVAAGPQWVGNDSVAFGSLATDLVADGADDVDLFVRDLAADTTALVTANEDGIDSDEGGSVMTWFKVARNGSAIAFQTPAFDFGPNDTNGFDDIYVARYHQHSDLSVSVETSASEVVSGGEVAFVVTVTAAGPDTSTRVRLGMLFGAGAVDMRWGGGDGQCDSPDVLPLQLGCGFGDLDPGESVSFKLFVKFQGAAGAKVKTAVPVVSDSLDLDGTDNVRELETTIVAAG